MLACKLKGLRSRLSESVQKREGIKRIDDEVSQLFREKGRGGFDELGKRKDDGMRGREGKETDDARKGVTEM
jgi:hypothetical protein